ncbi:HNH endonuclease [Klebsiella phage iPHaGe-KPN-11i]|nr:HNH endonuclease [Klebsiella phage iPHaGe-KPN-11i]
MIINKEKETDYTLSLLRESFSYNKDTGIFTCINKKAKRYFGKPAGTLHNSGYIRLGIRVDGKPVLYLAQRVAWAFVTGSWPENMIDHKDTIKQNNAFDNLREATRSINAYNYRRISNANASGYRGVHVDSRGNRVRYGAYYGKTRLGTFDSAEEAHEAYMKYVKSIHEVVIE